MTGQPLSGRGTSLPGTRVLGEAPVRLLALFSLLRVGTFSN